MRDDTFNGLVIQLQMFDMYTVLLDLTRQQITLCNNKLLLQGVPGQPDGLHAVPERRWDSVGHVGGGDKHDP